MYNFGEVLAEKNTNKWKLCCNSASILRSSPIRQAGVQKRIEILELRLQHINWSSIFYRV